MAPRLHKRAAKPAPRRCIRRIGPNARGYKAPEAGRTFADGGVAAEPVHTLGTNGEQAKAINTGLSPIAGASESQSDLEHDGAASFSNSPGGSAAVHDQLAGKQQLADTGRFVAGVADVAIRAVSAPGKSSPDKCRSGPEGYFFNLAEGEFL